MPRPAHRVPNTLCDSTRQSRLEVQAVTYRRSARPSRGARPGARDRRRRRRSRRPPARSMPETPLPPDLAEALARAVGARRRLVLAVSGGLDSIALLHAVARWRPADAAIVVATFDHGTGVPARRAARLVVGEARRLGLAVVVGRARGLPATEAAWRERRWRFLDRKSTRLNSSHLVISYAVFCLKKK